MKILFVSLGCDKNLVDSEKMLGMLQEKGYTFTDDEAEADVVVVNTCCFIGDAKEESVNTINIEKIGIVIFIVLIVAAVGSSLSAGLLEPFTAIDSFIFRYCVNADNTGSKIAVITSAAAEYPIVSPLFAMLSMLPGVIVISGIVRNLFA